MTRTIFALIALAMLATGTMATAQDYDTSGLKIGDVYHYRMDQQGMQFDFFYKITDITDTGVVIETTVEMGGQTMPPDVEEYPYSPPEEELGDYEEAGIESIDVDGVAVSCTIIVIEENEMRTTMYMREGWPMVPVALVRLEVNGETMMTLLEVTSN